MDIVGSVASPAPLRRGSGAGRVLASPTGRSSTEGRAGSKGAALAHEDLNEVVAAGNTASTPLAENRRFKNLENLSSDLLRGHQGPLVPMPPSPQKATSRPSSATKTRASACDGRAVTDSVPQRSGSRSGTRRRENPVGANAVGTLTAGASCGGSASSSVPSRVSRGAAAAPAAGGAPCGYVRNFPAVAAGSVPGGVPGAFRGTNPPPGGRGRGQPTPPAVSAIDLEVENSHCNVTAETDSTGEIRTKVFRIGAPLLRSTIPVALGRSGYRAYEDKGNQPPLAPARAARSGKRREDAGSDEDVETVLSISDHEREDQGHLAVTLDFPC